MAKKASFNFGANAKSKKTGTKKASKSTGKGTKSSGKSQAWRAYTGGSNAPIPD